VAELGRILIADDEETFLQSTADLLRREGYSCACALDGATATDMLRASDYDLLIADIRMAGNQELELIRDLPTFIKGLPVIVVTGYPSLRSAIDSIHLPVAAYLVKPFNFKELRDKVRRAIERYRMYHAISHTKEMLEDWQRELADVAELMRTTLADTSLVPIDAFLTMTLRNIAGSLADLKRLIEALAKRNIKQDVCQLLNCPRPVSLMKAVTETIEVLEKTKGAFKSKDLGELRRKLEALVKSGPE
jgi:DNA-binding NtrC family response regulator